MKKSLRFSLALLVTSAMFFTMTCANTAVLEPLEVRLGQPYSDCKYIESLLGPYLTLPAASKDRAGLISATSRLTGIKPDDVRKIVAAMLHVQSVYSPGLYSKHPSLFAWSQNQSLGMFLSIIRQADNIMKLYQKNITIIHTSLYNDAGLQSHYLTGILSYLRYERIFINIIIPGALLQFGRESRAQTWLGALECVRQEFQKVKYMESYINVNVYEDVRRYEQNIDPEKVASMSNSFYIGNLTTADIADVIEKLSQPTLSAFDVTGSQVCKAVVYPAAAAPVQMAPMDDPMQ